MRINAARSALSPVIVAFALLAACSAKGGDSTSTGPTVPGKTTSYLGSFADGSQTGSLSLSIASSSSDIVANIAVSMASNTLTVATGTLVAVDGTTTQLTGTFDTSSGALLLSGGSYSFTGTLTNGQLSGTFTATHGMGNFTTQPASSSGTAPKVYCGTYNAPGDFGWFNLVVSSSGTVTGFAVPFGATNHGVSLTGTLAGSTISLVSSENVHTTATVSSDGSAVTGTFTPNSGGLGTYSGSSNGCGAAGGLGTAIVAAGSWSTTIGGQSTIHFQLLPTGGSMIGAGTLTVPPILAISGPGTPAYTGNDFTITSGSFTSPNVAFTAALGANPTGNGGFYYGSLSFAGTVSAGTMTGTLTFTPPRTLSQLFGAQTLTGVTLARQ